MLYDEAFFATPDGYRLLERRWLPAQEAAAAVILVHGFLEHSGRYAEMAETLSRHGFAVCALDLRGHGRSEGPRAMITSFDQYVTDLETLFERVRRRTPELPVFVFGHSMGGAIVLRFALKCQAELRGLITSGASIRLGARVFPWLRRLAVVAGWLFPRLRLVRLGSSMLSRDPAVVADFRRDPLVFHGPIPLRTGAEIIRTGWQLESRLEAIRAPLLILHGTADVVTDPEASRELYRRAASTDKTLKLYEGLYHDLLHEPERGQVVEDILAWLRLRTGQSGKPEA